MVLKKDSSGTIVITCSASKPSYEKLIKIAGVEGQVLYPELSSASADVDAASVEKMFSTFYTSRYRQFIATLKFGTELTSQVAITPPPASASIQQNFEDVEVKMDQNIDIKGGRSHLSFLTSPQII